MPALFSAWWVYLLIREHELFLEAKSHSLIVFFAITEGAHQLAIDLNNSGNNGNNGNNGCLSCSPPTADYKPVVVNYFPVLA